MGGGSFLAYCGSPAIGSPADRLIPRSGEEPIPQMGVSSSIAKKVGFGTKMCRQVASCA